MSLFGEISLDPSKAYRAMDGVKQKASGLDSALSKVGGNLMGKFAALFSAQKAVGFFKDAIEDAKHIQELSNKVGLSIEHVQLLKSEADRTGESFEEMAASAEKMAAAIAKARERGTETMSAANVRALSNVGADLGDVKVGLTDALTTGARSIFGNPKEFWKNIGGVGGLLTGGLYSGIYKTAQNQAANDLVSQSIADSFAAAFRLPKKDPVREAAEAAEKKAQDDATEEQDLFMVRDDAAQKKAQEDAIEEQDLFMVRADAAEKERKRSALGSELNDRLDILKKRGLPGGDSLRSVGNFLGSDPSGILKQSQDTLKEIQGVLKRIESNTKEGLGL